MNKKSKLPRLKSGLLVLLGMLLFSGAVFPSLFQAFPQEMALEEKKEMLPVAREPLPQIVILAPVQNQKVTVPELQVKGEVSDDKEIVSLIVGGHTLGVSGSKVPFQHPVTLKKGRNVVYIQARDNEGNQTEHVLTVFCEICDAEEVKFNKKINEAVTKYTEKKSVQDNKEKYANIASLPVKGIIVSRGRFVTISAKTSRSKPLSTRFVISDGRTIALNTNDKDANVEGVSRKMPRIMVNGSPVMTRAAALVQNGRTYVTMEKELATELGARVVRDKRNGKQFVYFYAKGKTVKLAAYGQAVNSNGKIVHLDAPLKIKDGKLMLPFRALCEGLGYTVHWDGAQKTVYLQNSVLTT